MAIVFLILRNKLHYLLAYIANWKNNLCKYYTLEWNAGKFLRIWSNRTRFDVDVKSHAAVVFLNEVVEADCTLEIFHISLVEIVLSFSVSKDH